MNRATDDLWQLPEQLRKLVEEELKKGETIAWIGQPRPGRFAMRVLPIVLFAIPWTAFAVSFLVLTADLNFKNGFDAASLFGLPFVVIGLAMLSSRLWMMRKARKTAYVVTDRRALVFDGGYWSTTIRSFGPEIVSDLRRRQRADGSGDLIFRREVSLVHVGNKPLFPDVGFLDIANVKEIDELVRRIQSPAPPSDG